jgi:tetratricopeptide (TPR) repeat protein
MTRREASWTCSADSIGTARILLLVNYRPEYRHEWGHKTYSTQLRLDPLGKESADEMLSAKLGDGVDLAPLKRLIIEKTEGNPLFMEEMVQVLFDDRALKRNGAVKLTRSLNQLKIPPTVQDILAARIDRLSPEAKELLQTLAVFGMEFPLSLVRQVVKLPHDQINRTLSDLQTGEFVYEQPAIGDVEYEFKHILTRDVAYNSLLNERRKLLHERVARAIEALYHERLEDHYADLAHHYRLSKNVAKAVEYLCLAGEQSVDRSAYAQALVNVERALPIVDALPEGPDRLRAELRVRVMQGMAVSLLYGLASTERVQTFQRVCELGEQLSDESAMLRGLLNLGGAYLSGGEVARSLEMTKRCVELAERSQNPEALLAARQRLALLVWASGNLLEASALLGESMERVRCQATALEMGQLNYWVNAPAVLARVRHLLGRPDEALKLSDEALRRGRQLKHPLSLAAAIINAAMLRYQRGEPARLCENGSKRKSLWPRSTAFANIRR